MEQTDDNPPLGFRTIYDTDRFENVVGPIYFRDADGTRVAGLRVQKNHLNGTERSLYSYPRDGPKRFHRMKR